MQNVYDLAHELARSLKETDQFKDFKKCKEKVDANEDIKLMLDDLNKQNIAAQSALLSGQEPDPQLMERVQTLYQVVLQDPVAANYINAEYALSTIINDIYKILGEALE